MEQIQISLEGIARLLKDHRLVVPAYQRSYAWEEKHVQDLLRDLSDAIEKDESEYFLGSVVAMRKDERLVEIVDGQQRLATTTILLAAIRDFLRENGEDERERMINEQYLFSRDMDSLEVLPRLRLNNSDQDYFLSRVLTSAASSASGSAKVKSLPQSHQRIDLACRLIGEHVKRVAATSHQPIQRLLTWLKFVENRAKVIFVAVPDESNAFVIFETLNDRGLDLAITDLLKNHLFGLAAERFGETQDRWTSMIAGLEAAEDEAIAITYIRHLWSSKFGATREKDLYKSIKSRVNSKQQAIDLSNELAVNSRRYAAFRSPDHEMWKEYGPALKPQINALNILNMSQIRPLLLAVFERFEPDEVAKAVTLFVSWGVRFLIVGGGGGGVLEQHYCERARAIRDGRAANTRDLRAAMKAVVPNDAQFQAEFERCTVSNKQIARYYLRTLEMVANEDARGQWVPNENQLVVNLEHVLPQSPSADWALASDLARALYRRLGNLTILGAEENVAAANAPFAAKKAIYARSTFVLARELVEVETWDEEAIGQRQRRLAQLALTAWPA